MSFDISVDEDMNSALTSAVSIAERPSQTRTISPTHRSIFTSPSCYAISPSYSVLLHIFLPPSASYLSSFTIEPISTHLPLLLPSPIFHAPPQPPHSQHRAHLLRRPVVHAPHTSLPPHLPPSLSASSHPKCRSLVACHDLHRSRSWPLTCASRVSSAGPCWAQTRSRRKPSSREQKREMERPRR